MSTNLLRIGIRARRSPEEVFTSLYHYVTDVDKGIINLKSLHKIYKIARNSLCTRDFILVCLGILWYFSVKISLLKIADC